MRSCQFNCASVRLIAMLAVGILLSGCAEKSPSLYKVDGTVTHKGKPVPAIEVVFRPKDTAKFRESVALTDSQGKFVMKYGRFEGVAPGEHSVLVRDPAALQGGKTSADADYTAVLNKYGDEMKAPMTINVTSDMRNHELKLD